MKNFKPIKLIKYTISVLLLGLIVYASIIYAPLIKYLIMGNVPLEIKDTALTELVQDMGSLVTLKQSRTGTIENKTMALFGITANEIQIDYEYEVLYGVNLYNAEIRSLGERDSDNVLSYINKEILVYIPPAEIISHSLKRVGESRKSDFLKPISDKNIQQIMEEFENTLYNEYSTKEENLSAAWQNAGDQVVNILMKTVEEFGLKGITFKLLPLNELPK
ncbi:MAG: DUF4230 domain-containing protein [Christensenellaceae bacterium]|nr:DUF4230 domain-containing protein [Christensenellaceae bacterium]